MGVYYEQQTHSMRCELHAALGGFVHMHKEVELVYVVDGAARAYADRQTYTLKKGDLFFAFPNQIHYYEMIERGQFLLLLCSPQLLYDLGERLLRAKPDQNVLHIDAHDPLFAILQQMQLADGAYRKTTVMGQMHLLFAALLPRLNLSTVDVKNSTLAAVVTYCVAHFQENITLDTVAEELHLSKYYVSHLINRELNRSFHDYLNDLRVAEACTLLRETTRKIADISEEAGFGTIRSFNRAFLAVMKQSPLEYRAACRPKQGGKR